MAMLHRHNSWMGGKKTKACKKSSKRSENMEKREKVEISGQPLQLRNLGREKKKQKSKNKKNKNLSPQRKISPIDRLEIHETSLYI